MNWKATPPGIEIAAAWTAAACLGSATAFAVVTMAPLGAGLIEASGAGAVVACVAWLLIGRVDRPRGSHEMFVAERSLGAVPVTEHVVALDPQVEDDALLLDDPLPVITDDARVVRLFAAQPVGAATPTARIGAAEMVARIEDFLGHGRGSAAPAGPVAAHRPPPHDAKAALHAALADIRATLRHG